jgi:hypothetical protein
MTNPCHFGSLSASGKMYWKLSNKGDNKGKNAIVLRKMGPNESKIIILAKNFNISNIDF